MSKRLLIILLALILLGGGAVAYYFLAAPLPVTAHRVENRLLTDDLNLTGTLEATEERQLFATQPMTIHELPVHRGDRVAHGEVLVRGRFAEGELHVQEINTQLESLRSERNWLQEQILRQKAYAERHIQRLQEEVQRAVDYRDRVVALVESGALPAIQRNEAEQALNRARTEADVATQLLWEVDGLIHQKHLIEGQIQLLEDSRSVAEDQLEETVLRASSDWEVVEVQVQVGDRVASGTPIIHLQSLKREARVDVFAEDALRLQPDLAARLTGDALPEPLDGRISELYPRAIERMSDLGVLERRLPVVIELMNAPAHLIPGLPVDVQILLDEINSLAVPREAVFTWEGGDAVFRIVDERAEVVRVEVGLRSDRWMEIREGLDHGDVIIIRPPSELETGKRVRYSQ